MMLLILALFCLVFPLVLSYCLYAAYQLGRNSVIEKKQKIKKPIQIVKEMKEAAKDIDLSERVYIPDDDTEARLEEKREIEKEAKVSEEINSMV